MHVKSAFLLQSTMMLSRRSSSGLSSLKHAPIPSTSNSKIGRLIVVPILILTKSNCSTRIFVCIMSPRCTHAFSSRIHSWWMERRSCSTHQVHWRNKPSAQASEPFMGQPAPDSRPSGLSLSSSSAAPLFSHIVAPVHAEDGERGVLRRAFAYDAKFSNASRPIKSISVFAPSHAFFAAF